MNEASDTVSPQEWEQLRTKFSSSMMVNVPLSALAENLGVDWPIAGESETPEKYLGCSFEALQQLPEMREDPARIALLMSILNETLNFDDPFGEMVEQAESESSAGDDLLKALQRFEIPEDYPLRLTNLSAETQEFCRQEGIETIGAFVRFCQNMARNIVVGGDFRTFLNSLAQQDEAGVSRVLPLRPGRPGLHFPEAVSLCVRNLDAAERTALYRHYGGKPDPDQSSGPRMSQEAVQRLEARLLKRVQELGAWFSEASSEIADKHAQGQPLERLFVHLDDPQLERIAANLLKAGLPGSGSGKKGRGGWFRRLFRGS